MKNAALFVSICLSDIPKDKIKKHENGKLYLSLQIRPKKEPDQYGNNVFVALNPGKEEGDAERARVEAGGEYDKTVFLGSGQFIQFEGDTNAQNMGYADPEEIKDGLPF
jgi:hypothetical protein